MCFGGRVMMQHKSNQGVELVECTHKNNDLRRRAEEIISLRQSALHDQILNLEERRCELLILINRYKQSVEVHSDAISILSERLHEYRESILLDPSINYVCDSIKESVKKHGHSLKREKNLEKEYIKELILLNERYKILLQDKLAIDYMLKLLCTSNKY